MISSLCLSSHLYPLQNLFYLDILLNNTTYATFLLIFKFNLNFFLLHYTKIYYILNFIIHYFFNICSINFKNLSQ